MVGVSEGDIAKILGISVGTLRAWREYYIDFDQAWTDGVYQASTKVVNALIKSACGYDKMVWKETQHGMMQELKHVPANIPAAIFWLTNKHPDQWKSKVEHDMGAGGMIPVDVMTEIEAARRIAFALSKAINESRSIEHGSSGSTQSETE
jgi:hypothetical protein